MQCWNPKKKVEIRRTGYSAKKKKKKISNKKNTKTISSELDFTNIPNANHMNERKNKMSSHTHRVKKGI